MINCREKTYQIFSLEDLRNMPYDQLILAVNILTKQMVLTDPDMVLDILKNGKTIEKRDFEKQIPFTNEAIFCKETMKIIIKICKIRPKKNKEKNQLMKDKLHDLAVKAVDLSSKNRFYNPSPMLVILLIKMIEMKASFDDFNNVYQELIKIPESEVRLSISVLLNEHIKQRKDRRSDLASVVTILNDISTQIQQLNTMKNENIAKYTENIRQFRNYYIMVFDLIKFYKYNGHIQSVFNKLQYYDEDVFDKTTFIRSIILKYLTVFYLEPEDEKQKIIRNNVLNYLENQIVREIDSFIKKHAEYLEKIEKNPEEYEKDSQESPFGILPMAQNKKEEQTQENQALNETPQENQSLKGSEITQNEEIPPLSGDTLGKK